MVSKFFSKNGQILSIEDARIPLSNIEYSYGFGVYELLKIREGTIYFEKQHIERLFHSAEIIGLGHVFTGKNISKYIFNLLEKEKIETGNLKIILLGGKTKDDAQLFILPLSPLFPNRKFYSDGVNTITVNYERPFPQAKTLNMLGSFLAYKKAKEENCYDALLLDKRGNIVEGTRTNFFAIKNNIIYTQPNNKILRGVTREIVLHIAKEKSYKIDETNIPLGHVSRYDGAFLTSTSSKILPVKQIDEVIFPEVTDALKLLMQKHDEFLRESKGVFSP